MRASLQILILMEELLPAPSAKAEIDKFLCWLFLSSRFIYHFLFYRMCSSLWSHLYVRLPYLDSLPTIQCSHQSGTLGSSGFRRDPQYKASLGTHLTLRILAFTFYFLYLFVSYNCASLASKCIKNIILTFCPVFEMFLWKGKFRIFCLPCCQKQKAGKRCLQEFTCLDLR